jgi:hypothetical protein
MKHAIEDVPEWRFNDVQRFLSVARETPDRDLRLRSITQALETLRSFREGGVYALPPYPSILHELYLYYIDNKAFAIALSLLIFMHLNCHVYSYPQPHHPSSVERLYTMAKLCQTLIPTSIEEEDTWFTSEIKEVSDA